MLTLGALLQVFNAHQRWSFEEGERGSVLKPFAAEPLCQALTVASKMELCTFIISGKDPIHQPAYQAEVGLVCETCASSQGLLTDPKARYGTGNGSHRPAGAGNSQHPLL